MKAAPSSDKTPRASTRARRPGYVLAAVQSDRSGMAATGHIEISHMSWEKNDVCRKSPECPRRGDEGCARADEVLLFMGEFLAHSWSISSCARGSILLLLIINWHLNFRLMVAAFIAEGDKKKTRILSGFAPHGSDAFHGSKDARFALLRATRSRKSQFNLRPAGCKGN